MVVPFVTVPLIAAVAILGLSGCAPEAEPTRSPKPTPSATPLFDSDEEALAAAGEAFGRYIAVTDQVGNGGYIDPSPLEEAMTGDLLDSELKTTADFKSRSLRQVGTSTFDQLKLQQWSQRGVTFYVCRDVTNVDIVDTNGTSIVPPERLDRLPLEVEMVSEDGQLLAVRSDIWMDDFCR